MVQRLDFGKVSGKERTPQGGLRVPAFLTRTGVLTYTNADGSQTRELRSPEQVFDSASLATLQGATVTIGHPGVVTKDNWKDLSIGHVGDEVKADGRYVAARVTIQDAKAVALAEQGDLVEVSCGYECEVLPQAGEFEGERYDAIQTNIRYNHVGLGPQNWGRAGNAVALKLDGLSVGISYTPKVSDKADPKPEPTTNVVVKLDTAELDKVKAERDALVTKVATLETDLVTANDPKRIDGLVNARVSLVESARKLTGPEFKADGKSDLDVMIAAVVAADATFKADGKSTDYVRARFDLAVDGAKASTESVANVGNATIVKVDATEDPEEKANADLKERNRNAWKSKK